MCTYVFTCMHAHSYPNLQLVIHTPMPTCRESKLPLNMPFKYYFKVILNSALFRWTTHALIQRRKRDVCSLAMPVLWGFKREWVPSKCADCHIDWTTKPVNNIYWIWLKYLHFLISSLLKGYSHWDWQSNDKFHWLHGWNCCLYWC